MNKVLGYDEETAIRDLLVGKSVVKVNTETLLLSDGTVLKVEGNYGCGGCASGNYYVDELNECPNMIMSVEFITDDTYDDGRDWDEHDTTYQIFVYAENQKIKLLEVSGTDGNGYYGTGYWIQVTMREVS